MKNKEVWPFVFLLGLLLFNWPLMDIFEGVLPYYLYSVWVLFILAIALLASLKNRVDKNGHV